MDKRYYELASNELSGGIVDKALMAKAIAKAEGVESRAQSIYVGLRAEEIRMEMTKGFLVGRIGSAKEVASSWARAMLLPGIVIVFLGGAIWLLLLLSSPGGPLEDRPARSGFAAVDGSSTQDDRAEDPKSSAEEFESIRSYAETAYGPPDAPVSNSLSGQNAQFDMMLIELFSKFPEFDRNSSAFDARREMELRSKIDAYESSGATGPRALQAAVLDITGVKLRIPPLD